MKKHLATLFVAGLALTSAMPVMATNQTTVTTAQPKLTWQEAKQIGLKAVPGGTSTKLELDHENGKMVYDMEIVKDNIEHDLEIDANTGAILKHTQEPHQVITEQPKIPWDVAKKTALDKVPGGTSTKLELDRENGKLIYEIEIVTPTEEHDFEIDANTGAILKHEIDYKRTTTTTTTSATTTDNLKSQEEIKKIALTKVPGATVVKMELDHDKGKTVYEIKLRKGTKEYDLEIDATTGTIYKYELD